MSESKQTPKTSTNLNPEINTLKHVEQDGTPERQAIQALDATVERIFQDYPLESKPVTEDDPQTSGVVDTVEKLGHMFIERTTSPHGDVSYHLTSFDWGPNGRVAIINDWQQGGSTLNEFIDIETKGISETTQKSAATIEQTRAMLDRAFPHIEVIQKKSALRRLLGKIASSSAQK